jgi:hypothetical protein
MSRPKRRSDGRLLGFVGAAGRLVGFVVGDALGFRLQSHCLKSDFNRTQLPAGTMPLSAKASNCTFTSENEKQA